ncbi:hypothetical protein [Rhizobium leucaenae]|uniref:KTSC domain-containing protein n=1 Tax=Rhizobium leucaenae TaxID=29450 RepID=A0A7W6ZXC7_9HYPH|nr:hypothetical protein [Rhizobium leucaenae]MBB4570489.1 hypothetical protein [Rhizobium leucaenae]MBB6303391.1 hypothetical protein [Rhizobium leucaenae]
MKKIVLLSLLIASAATPALAISRYNSMSFTCGQARAIIDRERAVIMRYPSARVRNMTLYDRVVSDSNACDPGYYAYQDYMPTKDRPNCPVYTCRPSTDFDDDDLLIPHR